MQVWVAKIKGVEKQKFSWAGAFEPRFELGDDQAQDDEAEYTLLRQSVTPPAAVIRNRGDKKSSTQNI